MVHSKDSSLRPAASLSRRRILTGALALGAFTLTPLSALADGSEDTVSCDVVVVGAGGAGLSAALAAAQQGASVLVIEKMPMLGGNTYLAAGYILSARGKTPEETEENKRVIIDDILHEGRGHADPHMVEEVVEHSIAMIDWLKANGANLERYHITNINKGNQYRPSNHTLVGEELVQTLLQGLDNKEVLIKTLSNVREILFNREGRLSGVRISRPDGSTWRVHASSVVLATGGFAANEAMVAEHAPAYAEYLTTNSPGATGDGIIMGRAVGAVTEDMESVIVHPTTMPFSGLILPWSARANGAILLNDHGRRFLNELSRHVANDIREKSNGSAWLILDQQCVDNVKTLSNYARLGYLSKAHSVEELSRIIHVPSKTLEEQFARYADFCATGIDRDYHRPSLVNDLSHLPLYAVRVQPGVHYTTGGLKIDKHCRVLSATRPIAGLYAAGETTGGIFGKSRPEGAGLMLALVSGRMAGEQAAKYALENPIPDTSVNRLP